MNIAKTWLVFRKDWAEIRQNRQILLPVIILPIAMVVVLPLVAIQVPTMMDAGQLTNSGNLLPSQFLGIASGMTPRQAFVYVMTTVFFAPFTLLAPLIVSSIIAADSFAGEKERKTIEALLATPISDADLLIGKMFASFVPSMLSTLLAFTAYATITDALDWQLFGYPILPNLMWMLILVILSPEFAIAATGLTVIVSTRVSGTREAQQLSGLLVIPIVVIIFAQTSGVLILGIYSMIIMMVIMAIVDIIVLRLGLRLFNRERILSKL